MEVKNIMQRKFLITSFLTAAIIILTSITSVVGVQTTKTENENITPLFYKRLITMINKDNEDIKSNFIGKENSLNLFSNKKSYVKGLIDKAILIFQSNPEIIDSIFARIQKIPYTMKLLKENGINKNDLTKYAANLKNNPSLLKQEFDQIKVEIDPSQTPIPKGLSTSNPIGCVITIIALLPVFIVLALIIGTITIITCLNLGGCLETIMQNLINGLIQELVPA